MALALVFSLAACGGNETPEETTAPEVTEAAGEEATTAATEDGTTAATEDGTTAAATDETTVAGETTAAAADETTVAGETTVAAGTTAATGDKTTAASTTKAPAASTTPAAPSATMTAAEFASFFNAETAKIAKAGKYSYNRVCSYTSPIDVGGATGILNGIISAIDENSNLDTVVGDFLGIGTKKGTLPKDDVDSDYKVKAAALQAGDLGSFKASNGTYTFTLANATNPKKTNATPISRFTNDFITHEEVVEGIAGFTTAIKVDSTTVNYKNIKVTVAVANGKITSISYSYAFDAQLTLKAGIKINGTGAATTNATFSNIAY